MKTSRIRINTPVTPPFAPTNLEKPRTEPFGLFGLLESKRVTLPLKGVECDFAIFSGVAEVSVTQVFRHENEKPFDCEYLFPLPADASVYFCEADINGRTIRAQVRERQEARQIAAEKKAAGFRTALVEAERENLFTLSLGNVQPGDLIIIRLKYFQTLRSLAGMPSLEIPFCPGIRYIPGNPLIRSNRGKGTADDTDEVPDASKISPVRIDSEHPDAAYIDVRGTLDAAFVNEQELSSPSHHIVTQRTGGQLRVSLSNKGEVPDRDFVLRWSKLNSEAVASRAWIREKDKQSYALLEIRAPKQAPTQRPPVDFYFLVDRSGSMAGEKWNKAAEALRSCMKVIGPADRAMVTFFENRFQDFAERPLSPTQLLEDRQFQSIHELGTGGGTELRPALKHVLELANRHSGERQRNLILITDAQIGNESAILDLMKPASNFPVHCFGIDVALNDSLLLALSRQQGGTFHSLNPNDDIEKAVTVLGQTLGQPVLLQLQLSNGWETADAVIPNLYAGQVHYLSARSPNGRPLELAARNASLQPINIQFATQGATSDAPYLHWCRSRIQRLSAEGHAKEAIALSTNSNLICPLTAFIAWDESEKVPIASHQLVQPCMELAAGKVMFCRSATAVPAAGGFAKKTRAFQRFAADPDHDQLSMLREAPALDELDLMRQLSDICHSAAVPDWQPLVKAIFDWLAAATDGAERSYRLEAIKKLIETIGLEARLLHGAETMTQFQNQSRLLQAWDQRRIEKARKKIHKALKKFVDKLPATK